MHICEFKDSLFYREGPRPLKATYGENLSQNKQQQNIQLGRNLKREEQVHRQGRPHRELSSGFTPLEVHPLFLHQLPLLPIRSCSPEWLWSR